jgi:hypothetical protein
MNRYEARAMVVILTLILIGGWASWGYSVHGPYRAFAWLLCAVAGSWALIRHPDPLISREPVSYLLYAFLLTLLWSGLQLIPLPAGFVTSLNPEWRESVAVMERTGLTPPEKLTMALAAEQGRVAWNHLLASILFFLAALAAASRRTSLWWLTRVIAFVCAAEGLAALVRALGGENRAYGFLFNPNHSAALILMGVPLIVAHMRVRHRRRTAEGAPGLLSGQDPGIVLGALVLAVLAGWIGTLSRGSLLLGFPVLVAWAMIEVALSWKRRRTTDEDSTSHIKWLIPLTAVLLLVILAVSSSALDRFGTRFSSGDVSAVVDQGRLALVRAAFAALGDTNYLGLGLHGAEAMLHRHLGAVTRYAPIHAHNDWVEVPAELGIIGFVLVMIPLVIFASKFVRGTVWVMLFSSRSQTAVLQRAALAGACSALAHAAADFHLRVPLAGFCFLALLAIAFAPGRLATEEEDEQRAES